MLLPSALEMIARRVPKARTQRGHDNWLKAEGFAFVRLRFLRKLSGF